MVTRRVTLAEVASQAGVSGTTVSFVLSGRAAEMRISVDAQQRVLRAADELGYRPNLTARSLRTTVTQTIGLVSDSIASTQYAGQVIRGCVDAARKHGRLLFIAETEGDPEVERRLVEGMLDRQVDGLIYAAMFTRTVELPSAVRSGPVVLLNCLTKGLDGPSVIPDEVGGGRAAARALLDAGHRSGIVAIGGHQRIEATPGGVFAGRERMRGIREVLREERVRLARVVECAWDSPDNGYREVKALLAAGAPPKALICANDRLACGAYQAMAEHGLRVPEDVSVVSFDDSDLASWLRPQLTSVALPHYEMGRLAVELLATGQLRTVTHRVPMPARIRASIAAPRS